MDASGDILGTVELYDTSTGAWTALPSLNVPRAYLTVVAGTDGKVYAIGGVDSTGHSVATVEAYDQSKNAWTAVASLNTARSHCAGALGLDFLFVTGGIDATGKVLNSTEIYSLAFGGSWTPWFPMNQARSDHGLALGGDGFLHAFGGKNSTGELNSVEGYNFNTGAWTVEPETLPTVNAFLAAVEGLNGNDYLLGGKVPGGFQKKALVGVPPAVDSHSVVYFLHQFDEPYINGAFAMDSNVPLNNTLLQLSLLGNANWATFPAVTGTIESGGTVTVFIPSTLGLGLINGVTLSATDLHGGSVTQLGSASSLLGLSGTINIPITTPLTLKNQVLVLNLSTLLGLNINLSNNSMYLQITGLDGIPANP